MKKNDFSVQEMRILKEIYSFLLSKGKFLYADLISDIMLNSN